MNLIRVKFSPFLLKEKAKIFLRNLRSGSIKTWDDMQMQFFFKKILYPTKQILSKDESPLSLKSQERPFTNVGIGRMSYLTFVHTMVLKYRG